MRVSDLMTPEPVATHPDAPLKDAARKMTEHRISGLPVTDSDNHVVGILTESDFVDLARAGGGAPGLLDVLFVDHKQAGPMTVSDIMTRKVVTIGPDASHVEAARVLHRKRIKRLPVVDDEGRLLGVISRADLLRIYSRSDEEIRDLIVDRILAKVMAVDPAMVEIRVEDGFVFLGGRLPTRTETQLLDYMVSELPGVMGVECGVRFDTDDTRYIPEPVPFGVPHRNW
jgi:CBS-domain-containing membrane protein